MATTTAYDKIGASNINFATGGSGAAEEFVQETSKGGELTQEKVDASHIKFRSVSGSVEDLVDGGGDVSINIEDLTCDDITCDDISAGDITASGTLTMSAMTSAGFLKNSAAGLFSGGNSLAAGDMPTGIDAAKIADGSISNTEFQYLNGVSSNIQTQIDGKQGNNKYAILTHRVSTGVDGPAAAAGSWETRVINSEDYDPDSIVSIASNRFTLADAGDYRVDYEDIYVGVGYYHRSRLYNYSDSAYVDYSESMVGAVDGTNAYTFAVTRGTVFFTIAASKAFELRSYNSYAGMYGEASGMGIDEIYVRIVITKLT